MSSYKAAKISKNLYNSSQVNLKKVWKNYTFQRGVQVQHLSPFEIDVTAGMAKGMYDNAIRQVKLWWPFWAPATIAFSGILYGVLAERKRYLMSHRD